jgi:hypothetical protein
MKAFALTACTGLMAVSLLSAQEVQRFTGDISGGFTEPVGNTGRNLDRGWNIQGGVGVNFTNYVGAKIDVGFNDLGINSGTLASLGVPGGDVHIFSATLDPIVHLNPKGPVDFYLIGGGGLYHRYQEFTAPTTATVTGFDPFFGFFPVQVAANQVLESSSVNKPGVNGGAGVAFGTRWHVKVFAEARYHRIFMSNGHIDYVPVSFGFRW